MDLHKSTAKDARKQKRLRTLGTDNPICVTCSESDCCCLELHHIAGRKYNAKCTVIVCRNCHRKLTDMQKDHPAPLGKKGSWLERIERFIWGRADLLALINGTVRT